MNPQLDTSRSACPSPHSLSNNLGRVAWAICWWTLFRLSPRPLFLWRVVILRLFGADVCRDSRIDPSVKIWAPWNLSVGRDTSIGAHVDVYNVAPIRLGDNATVSQYTYLCSASHDISDPTMRLTMSPITIANSAWVCARAFLAPGTTVGEGAVVGACSVVVKDVPDWTVVAGNPAAKIRMRRLNCEADQ